MLGLALKRLGEKIVGRFYKSREKESRPVQHTTSASSGIPLMMRGFAEPQATQAQSQKFQPLDSRSGEERTQEFLNSVSRISFAPLPQVDIMARKWDERKAARAEAKLRANIQAKLAIGAVGDKYEQEADQVASQVVQKINIPENVQRHEEEEIQAKSLESVQRVEEEEELQMKPLSESIQRVEEEDEELQMRPTLQRRSLAGGGDASEELENSIQQARGGGQFLDPELQDKMGQAMGADFSDVKVHTDSQSDQLNQSIQAKAFTTGKDVFFRQGEYDPGSSSGQELIAHELTHVVQQGGGGKVQRSPLKNIVQRDDELLGGFGSDAIEGGGNFLEFLEDAAGAIATISDSSSSKVEKGIAGSKALGSLTGTVLAGLKANDVPEMTSCLEAMSEGLKIFDAGKEVWEAVRKVDFWNDTTMQTFENVAVVVGKFGDFILGSSKIVNAFVSAMEWTTGRLNAFVQWIPLSELIIKGSKFLLSVKKWIFAYTSYIKLKVVKDNTPDPTKNQQVGYLIDEQWSRLKNGAVPFASTGVDFASDTAKYFPSLGINVAIAASLGTASKAVPFGHKVLATGYDYMRQGWRNMIKSYASTNVAGYLAATDKADLTTFRDGLVNFVLAERNQTNGMIILESLGLGQSVQTMLEPEAREAIEDAVKDIK
jgi:hypothetical protein